MIKAIDDEKIGVYVCHCGTNISQTVDISEVVDFASNLPNVTIAREYKYMCSDPGQDLIKKDIDELKLTRVVVSSCSPLMHEVTFRAACEDAGLNQFLFQMANIREHCSWVTTDRDKATNKAKQIIEAAVSRVRYHEPLQIKKVPVNPDTLIVGGGIAGIEAALTLANAGKKVYLVEKMSTIGGHMAQFDKTFPTLDCAACILTPKMVSVGQSKNIELLTFSEVKEVSGYVGNFKVKIRKKPRYVFEEKCTGCGECEKVCPVEAENEFDLGLSKKHAIYRTFPQAVPNIFTIDKKGIPPCRAACPAEVNPQGYIALISQGKFKEALNLIREAMPFASVCGRVCYKPCEPECERGKVDEPLAIDMLKRFVSDYDSKKEETKPDKVEAIHKEKIAIIGSGPAGLTAAYFLVKNGYNVNVFEKMDKPGGILRYGIPEYRLPANVLERDISYITNVGVNIKTNSDVNDISNLLNDYNSIFISTGAHRSAKLGIEGEEESNIIYALDFLREIKTDKKVDVGKKVAVVGGGNAAIDAARSALRLGASEVSVLYRRTKDEMPAIPEEVDDAIKEGVNVLFLIAPNKIIDNNGSSTSLKLECQKMKLGENDSSGRPKPVPIEGSEVTMDFDTVIAAIGQLPELPITVKSMIQIDKGMVKTDPATFQTTHEAIFAGGDVTGGKATVINAIAQGKEASESIHRYLRGKSLTHGRGLPIKKVTEVETRDKELMPRTRAKKIALDSQQDTFDEVEKTITEKEALYEASRCLNCGLCSECMECEKVCEPDAIYHRMEEEIKEIEVGNIIIATGFDIFDASKAKPFGYGKYPNVYTSMEFERLSHASGPTGGKIVLQDGSVPKSVAILHCVGSRDENYNEYCSRVCCMYSLKIAHLVRDKLDAEVYELYIDMRASGKGYEEFYKRVMEEDVIFIRGRGAEVTDFAETPEEKGKLIVKCEDTLLAITRRIPVDMVILAVGLEATKDASNISKIFSISCTKGDFFLEKHPKLAPVSTSSDGIFIAGACQGPKDIPDTVAQANAAAGIVLSMINKGEVELEPITASIDEEACSGCRICIGTCPYSAIEFNDEKRVSVIEEILCKGCGSCVAACPSGAASQKGFDDDQIFAEIEGALGSKQ